VALLEERGETLLGDTERAVVVGDVGNRTLAGDVGELAGDDSVEVEEDVDSRRRVVKLWSCQSVDDSSRRRCCEYVWQVWGIAD